MLIITNNGIDIFEEERKKNRKKCLTQIKQKLENADALLKEFKDCLKQVAENVKKLEEEKFENE